MQWMVETLRHYPEIAIFLALALGFVIGPIKLGKFSLGNVTGVLLMGVLIGQLEITISSDVKSVFFLMFLFAVGYGVGPQFFRGLKSDGLPQVLFACLVCVSVLISAFVAAKLAGYNAGQAAGLLSGAATISAVLGVASDSINNLGLPPGEAKKMIDAMPVAYAVTYLFGTAGSAWFLASMGPKLLRVDLAKECEEYEAKMGGGLGEEESLTTYPRIALRAYSIASVSKYVGKTISDLEKGLAPSRDFVEKGRGPARVFIENIRTAGRILDPDPRMVIQSGDVMAVAAAREVLLRNEADLGPEVDDRELLEFPAEILDVVITNKNLAGKTLQQIAESQQANQNGRGVFLRKLIRGGQDMLRVGGFARTDLIHDFSPAGNTSKFVTSSIPTGPNPGNDNTSMSVAPSRLSLELRNNTKFGPLRIYYENDFNNGPNTTNSFRLRHFYGQWQNVLVGQTWSAWEDADAIPDTVDFEGPNSWIFRLQPQLRYTYALNKQNLLAVSVEQPNTELASTVTLPGGPVTVNATSPIPDFVLRYRYEQNRFHIQNAWLFRSLGGFVGASTEKQVLGWGGMVSAAATVYGKDNIMGHRGKAMDRLERCSSLLPRTS